MTPEDQAGWSIRMEQAVRSKKRDKLMYIDKVAKSGKRWEIISGLWMSTLVGFPFWPVLLLSFVWGFTPWKYHEYPDWLTFSIRLYFICWVGFLLFSGCIAVTKLRELSQWKARRLEDEWLADATEEEKTYYCCTRPQQPPLNEW